MNPTPVKEVTPEFKEEIRGHLHKRTIVVEFVKNDGSTRVMTCTLDSTLIPTDKLPKGSKKASNENVQPVFDVEKQAWRSFCWDALIGVTL